MLRSPDGVIWEFSRDLGPVGEPLCCSAAQKVFNTTGDGRPSRSVAPADAPRHAAQNNPWPIQLSVSGEWEARYSRTIDKDICKTNFEKTTLVRGSTSLISYFFSAAALAGNMVSSSGHAGESDWSSDVVVSTKASGRK